MLTRMIPGTAVGVLVGDLIYTVMAFRLARRTGRSDVTAMPLGLDTPSTFGAVFLIIGPSYQAALGRGLDPESCGTSCLVFRHHDAPGVGNFQIGVCSVERLDQRVGAASRIARFVDSDCTGADQFSAAAGHCGAAGGGLGCAGVDAGDVDGALAVSAAVSRRSRGGGGRLSASITACTCWAGAGAGRARVRSPSLALRAVLPLPVEDWLDWFARSWREAVGYLPVAIPLALATVVGGIDCTESAAAAGDDYPTGQIIAAEGLGDPGRRAFSAG